MIPTNSSGTTNGCDNISSNCVIWQGPDIACIDLCAGDTISEVTAKIAQKVCDIITDGVAANPDLTGLDLTCLNIKGVTPTELVPVLQAMVNQICANTGGTRGNEGSSLPNMTLPACMQYNDPSGNPVTELPLDQFATLIANQVCTNLASINTINSTLTSLTTRVDVLEACVLPCSGAVVEAQIVPTCVSNVGVLTDVSVVVLALESAFCALQNAVGLPSTIGSAISQTFISGSTTQLSNSSSSYSGVTGWNNNPSTLAQSVQNAWVVIDDMYNAILDIQTNCCPGGCDGVTFGYSTTNTLNTSTGVITDIVFNFTPSMIPSTFNDSAGYSQVTITDADGQAVNTVVSVSSLQNTPSGISVNVASLNVYNDLNVNVDFRVTDGSDTCEGNQSSVVAGIIPCPSPTLSAITQDGLTVSFSNALGTAATYILDILDGSNTVVATTTINNAPSLISHTFTGLTANTAYSLRVTVQRSGGTKVCPEIGFTTAEGTAPCSNGMDVVFIVDYTSSMTSTVNEIKTGASSLVSTIDSASGANNYRIGLVTADEGAVNQPAYNNCVDYTSLPSTQRVINFGGGTYQFYTAWEMMGTNNGTSFTTQVQKLNKGVDGTCVNMGQGAGGPEPMDIAIENVVGTSEFTGAFRSNVAKYILAFTDNLPGGDQDQMNMTVWSRIQSLITTCNNNGIKVFVLGTGTALDWDNGGTITPIYPWRELAIQTGGNYTTSSDATTISSEIIAGCS